MTEELLRKANKLLYFLTKEAASYSFEEFLEEIGLTYEDYKEIKKELAKTGITETYL